MFLQEERSKTRRSLQYLLMLSVVLQRRREMEVKKGGGRTGRRTVMESDGRVMEEKGKICSDGGGSRECGRNREGKGGITGGKE